MKARENGQQITLRLLAARVCFRCPSFTPVRACLLVGTVLVAVVAEAVIVLAQDSVPGIPLSLRARVLDSTLGE